MPHLDDGHIAELIDSAGAAGGTDRAVAAHLRECAACRERVEEARALAAEARRILARAVPSGRAASVVPPFDEVLVRAGHAAPRRRRGVPWRGLAWAATVVMAVGVGWYARGELLGPTGSLREAGDAVAPMARLERTGDDRAPSSLDTLPAAAAGRSSVAATPAPARALASEPTARVDRDEAAAPGGTRGAVVPAESALVPPRQERQPAAAEAPRPAPAPQREERARLQTENEVADRRVVGLVAPQAAKAGAADQVAVAFRWQPVTTTEATRLLGREPLVVRAYPVLDVSVLGDADSVVRVRQASGDSTVLELLQWRDVAPTTRAREAGPEADRGRDARALPPFIGNEARATVGGLRVVARAALDVDSLRVLLAGLR
ncbi:MAG: hypothetical protein OER21_10970 [Gemmatimonadota bacterium]|nr:hypothetical protein [Gemmatimonadota bacterium]